MNSYKTRMMVTAVCATLSQACDLGGIGGYDLRPTEFKPCTQQALKVTTLDCPWTECGGSAKIPLDLTASPVVARLDVGARGFLRLGVEEASDDPKGCLPEFPAFSTAGLIEWETSSPAVVSPTSRGPNLLNDVFVDALRPGEAVVYAQVRGVGRVDFAACPNTSTGWSPMGSCVPVAKIIVAPKP